MEWFYIFLIKYRLHYNLLSLSIQILEFIRSWVCKNGLFPIDMISLEKVQKQNHEDLDGKWIIHTNMDRDRFVNFLINDIIIGS